MSLTRLCGWPSRACSRTGCGRSSPCSGVTIGVAAVILLVAVGHGSAAAVQTQIEGLGTNMLTIQTGGRIFGRQAATSSSFTFLTMKDVTTLGEQGRTRRTSSR